MGFLQWLGRLGLWLAQAAGILLVTARLNDRLEQGDGCPDTAVRSAGLAAMALAGLALLWPFR